MTESEIKHLASTAAHEALEQFLLVLGVNVSTSADKLELQKDFHHVRQSRLMVGAMWNKVLMAASGSAVTLVVAALVFYVTNRGH